MRAVPVLILLFAIRLHGQAPNLILIVTDDQRPDTIHSLGAEGIRTPNLDRMVDQGTVFNQAFCSFPLCVPSRAEILTGRTGWKNGVYYRGGRLAPGSRFLGEELRSVGYRTVYCGKWMNDGHPLKRGYDQTAALFTSGGAGALGKEDRYDDAGHLITGYRGWTFKDEAGRPELEKGIGVTAETSRHIAEGALASLEGGKGKPLFLHVNFTAPHDPLMVPPRLQGRYLPEEVQLPGNFMEEHPFDHGNLEGRDELLLPIPRDKSEVRELLSRYRAVIEEMDHQLGRILKRLEEEPWREGTYVLFTSDHGLAVGSHGLLGKQNMYEHTMRVPFLVTGPGVGKGVRREEMVTLRDLYPTLVDLAGIHPHGGLEGASLRPLLEGGNPDWRGEIFGYFYDYQRMVRTDRWKLIHYPELKKWQLFDLDRDPLELENLYDVPERQELVSGLKKRMAGWFHSQGDPLYP